MHLPLLLSTFLAGLRLASAGFPNGKIYGVNLGNWLVFEPWMAEQEWKDMGGEQCSDCSTCIRSEWALTKAFPHTADQLFAKHWSSWFTQADVDQLVAAGINTVRIPLGFWIVEPLVDRSIEFYPKGGLGQLKRGLAMLKKAGIQAILDHHALPGVAAGNQMFAGNCTNLVTFYTDAQYQRALTWTAVMTALGHLDPDFDMTFSIQAVNEPNMNAATTPGYGDFQKNFVQTVRAVELSLGITVPGMGPIAGLTVQASNNDLNVTLASAASSTTFSPQTKQALRDALPMLLQLAVKYELGIFNFGKVKRSPYVTNFMDVNWQFNSPSNPADAAIGPQAYDNHLYYSFGGVADANENAYLTSICNLNRVQNDAAQGNSPLWFGEWGISTQFNATDEFLNKWADAQKLAYSKGAGWIFWNFKIEISELEGSFPRQWSYFEGLRLGYLTKDPSQYHDPNVCANYTTAATTS